MTQPVVKTGPGLVGLGGGQDPAGNPIGQVTNDGWRPDPGVTGLGRHAENVLNYTAEASGGAVASGEQTRWEWTLAEKVTAFILHGFSLSTTITDFQGYYVVINQVAGAGELAALRSNSGISTDLPRRWCPKGDLGLFWPVTGSYITSCTIVAIDNDATPNNRAELYPF